MEHPQRLKSVRTTHWTNAPSPATTVGHALLHDTTTDYSALEHGIPVLKVTRRGQWKPRILTISKDRFALFVTHQTMGRGHGVWSKMAQSLPLPLLTRQGVVGFTNRQTLREQFVRSLDVADLDFVQWGCIATQKLECARIKPDDVTDLITIGHSGNRTLDLYIANPHHRELLIQCLQHMRAAYQAIRVAVSNEALLLRYIWYDVDVDQTGAISETEFLKILARINFHVPHPLQHYRQEAGQDELTYPQVMTLLQKLKQQVGGMANSLWNQVFGAESEWVSSQDFLNQFVHAHQGEHHVSLDDVERLLSFLNQIETNLDQEPRPLDGAVMIHRQRFDVYLHHELNNAYDPWALHHCDESSLQWPLSYYWINTSHNTYLTGDQLQSISSVEMYMNALRRGCKCVELDCWDGDKNKDGICRAVVYHGMTLTSKVWFADIIRVVNCYVDQHPNTLPIILSLENHCSHSFQKQMAADLKAILGNKLFVPQETDHNVQLPSPASLRGKIVLKGKRPPEPDDTPIEDDEEEDPYGAMSPKSATPSQEEIAKKGKPPKVVKELASLTLFHGTKYKEFKNPFEPKIHKIVHKHASNSPQWREYNVSHMTRTYPAGARVDSSNYNPVLAWALGCQLVALNFQTADTALVLNDGLFAQQGNCGYILKPDSVLLQASSEKDEQSEKDSIESGSVKSADEKRTDQSSSDSKDPVVAVLKCYQQLTHQPYPANRKGPFQIGIRILSGSCLPKPRGAKLGESIDPYVTVAVHDIQEKADGTLLPAVATHSSAAVPDNGFCPQWNETQATEFVIHNPDVAFLHFSLIEEDIGLDDKVGDAVIPVRCLRFGYRSILLHDRNATTRSGPFAFATLLVHIVLK